MNDRTTICQLFGCLMRCPHLLGQVDKYNLSIYDFNSRFDKYIYSAIKGLQEQGAKSIEPIDIANFLDSNASAAKEFNNLNGIEFLQDAIEFSAIDTFDYYYNKLKKLNLLRDLKRDGFDTSIFYDENLIGAEASKVNEQFENLTTKDICDTVKRKLLKIESDYAKTEEVQVMTMADGIEDFIKDLSESIDIGLPVQGKIYNKIISGAELGALTIRSGSSGLGKTRQAIADACYLAYPVRYDSNIRQWVQTGSSEKVLFIITEQTYKQIRKMVLAYLTDINESRFKTGRLTADEQDRLQKAVLIINDFAENMTIIKMPSPTIELLKTTVREQCLTQDIHYVFFDYIFINPALLKDFKGFSLRDDEILLMVASALKDLAVELNVAMFTSTQVNAKADDNKNIRNEASLAGGRSTINKADNGAIMARPTPEEIEILQPLSDKYGTPNMVTDMFKVRSGEWTQVRIWSKVDLGRMKKEDLFVTDARLDPIEGFWQDGDDIEIHNWDDEEYQKIKGYVNNLNQKGLLD